MIKKDIAYELKEIGEDDINEIFKNADNEMVQMENAMFVKEKKKKRMNPFKATLISTLILLIIAVIIIGIIFIKEVGDSYSTVKDSIKETLTEQVDNILEKDEDSLTTDEYYQKQILMLIPKGKIEKTIDALDNKDLLTMDSDKILQLFAELIPEDKYDECEQIFKEWENAKELEKQSNEKQNDININETKEQE